MSAVVLALAGTDHHPFDRLVEWMDVAATRRADVRFVVQHGSAPPPRVAEGHAFLAHDVMVGLIQQSSVVVCHGGPGTIMDAREAGRVPLCMPRDPRLGEHVDDHQQRFVAVVGAVGLVRPIGTLEGLLAELDGGLAGGLHEGEPAAIDGTRQAARARAAAELDHLMSVRIPRPRRHRPTQLSGPM
ncbi:glycosyltransferase [Nocardioides sp. SYSU D00065]|uniref:glycosyltransferase n=1 Tax=Nocardioides sp. SYSU D00065 TaxID=2817378 RepID=UPI001B33CAA8|nr:glycosyltransferase [Nocardioides sp. SYSU D00065]